MATIAQSVPNPVTPLTWFREFLKQELAPYPGRIALVARMVIATTLVMIISMTFRIPDGAYGAIYALTISRESPQGTIRAARTVGTALAISAADVLIGALFFLDDPTLRFLWVIGTLFTLFYAISAMTNYAAAARFGYLVAITIPLWDRHVSGEEKVEGTLWALWVMILASVITVLVELAFAGLVSGGDVVRPIAERLASVEAVLTCYAADRPLTNGTKEKITRLSTLGTSLLRRLLRRSTYSQHYQEQMGAVVGLVTRLVDIAANLTYLDIDFAQSDRKRIGNLVENIAAIRVDLLRGRVPTQIRVDGVTHGAHAVPLLGELERTVQLILEVFAGSQSLNAYAPSPLGREPRSPVFVPDWLSNSEHAKFALKGCFAASLCYLIYNALDWPGISTAVTTCVMTGLTTIGASHQRQILRFAGTLIGGVGIGMGAQVFILPHIDSIAGFTVLFVVVCTAMAWVATSSPRLSYFGVQLATGFYLVHLQEFKIQTSLAVARDRVVGLLLGLFMMWLVFDQLWGAPAAVQMKRTFISTLRLLAQFAREPVSKETRAAVDRALSLRETINKNFDKVRSLGDAVLLEFGPSRHQDLALRDRLRIWQPRMRVLFLTRIALLKYRIKYPGFELPPSVASAQEEFDEELAKALDAMANRLEGKPGDRNQSFDDSVKHLEKTIEAQRVEELEPALAEQLQTFVTLSRRIEKLAVSLDQEI